MNKKNIYIIIAVLVVLLVCTMMINNKNNQVSQQSRSSKSTIKVFTLDELRKHNAAKDCWIALDGKVYDATSFIASGKHDPKILDGCGIDATEGFNKIRKHSGGKTQMLLPDQFIGNLN